MFICRELWKTFGTRHRLRLLTCSTLLHGFPLHSRNGRRTSRKITRVQGAGLVHVVEVYLFASPPYASWSGHQKCPSWNNKLRATGCCAWYCHSHSACCNDHTHTRACMHAHVHSHTHIYIHTHTHTQHSTHKHMNKELTTPRRNYRSFLTPDDICKCFQALARYHNFI